jgi:hypothetical protein
MEILPEMITLACFYMLNFAEWQRMRVLCHYEEETQREWIQQLEGCETTTRHISHAQ